MEDTDKPYWEMSKLHFEESSKYDWIYKRPPPKVTAQIRISLSTGKPVTSSDKVRKKNNQKSNRDVKPTQTFRTFEMVGYKKSNYSSVPSRPALRGMTAPVEHGNRDIFQDMHTPIQITKKFSGNPILSVPLTSQKKIRHNHQTHRTVRNSDPNIEIQASIHDILFEESVDTHEDIDPWGFSRNETIDVPEITTSHGLKISVSRLNH